MRACLPRPWARGRDCGPDPTCGQPGSDATLPGPWVRPGEAAWVAASAVPLARPRARHRPPTAPWPCPTRGGPGVPGGMNAGRDLLAAHPQAAIAPRGKAVAFDRWKSEAASTNGTDPAGRRQDRKPPALAPPSDGPWARVGPHGRAFPRSRAPEDRARGQGEWGRGMLFPPRASSLPPGDWPSTSSNHGHSGKTEDRGLPPPLSPVQWG